MSFDFMFVPKIKKRKISENQLQILEINQMMRTWKTIEGILTLKISREIPKLVWHRKKIVSFTTKNTHVLLFFRMLFLVM